MTPERFNQTWIDLIRAAGDAGAPPDGRPRLIPGPTARRRWPGVAEGGDHLFREAVEVCELDVERGAERGCADDSVEAGIALLYRLQLLDDVLRPAGEEAAGLHRVLDCRQFHGTGKPGVAHRRDLLISQCPHEAQFAEHLHVLFVMGGGLADRLLAGGRDVELIAERQPLAQFELDAAPGISRLEAEHVPLDGTALGRPAADQAADAVLCNELEGALRAALGCRAAPALAASGVSQPDIAPRCAAAIGAGRVCRGSTRSRAGCRLRSERTARMENAGTWRGGHLGGPLETAVAPRRSAQRRSRPPQCCDQPAPHCG